MHGHNGEFVYKIKIYSAPCFNIHYLLFHDYTHPEFYTKNVFSSNKKIVSIKTLLIHTPKISKKGGIKYT